MKKLLKEEEKIRRRRGGGAEEAAPIAPLMSQEEAFQAHQHDIPVHDEGERARRGEAVLHDVGGERRSRQTAPYDSNRDRRRADGDRDRDRDGSRAERWTASERDGEARGYGRSDGRERHDRDRRVTSDGHRHAGLESDRGSPRHRSLRDNHRDEDSRARGAGASASSHRPPQGERTRGRYTADGGRYTADADERPSHPSAFGYGFRPGRVRHAPPHDRAADSRLSPETAAARRHSVLPVSKGSPERDASAV